MRYFYVLYFEGVGIEFMKAFEISDFESESSIFWNSFNFLKCKNKWI